MKIIFSFILLVSSPQAWADACALEYNQAIGNTDIFSFDDNGKITVHQPDKVLIDERKDRTHRIVLKRGRAEFLVRYQGKQLVSIRTGLNRMRTFDDKCQKLQQAMDENARTKIDAAEAASKEAAK